MAIINNKEGKSGPFHFIVVFLLGLLFAATGFLYYQSYQTQKLAEGLRNDEINIIQAYNNLVNNLTQQGVLKPASAAKESAAPANANTNK